MVKSGTAAAQGSGNSSGNSTARFDALLRSLIRDPATVRLPSIAGLARTYHLSIAGVRAALARLQDEGLIAVEPRRRAVVVANMQRRLQASAPFLLSSEESLYRAIRSRMASGAYRPEQPLPKAGFLAHDEHVATRTVVRVYRRLLHDGYVYKRGRRRLICGSPASAAAVSTPGRCVLIVQPAGTGWKDVVRTRWTLPFANSFMREMLLYGIEPKTIVWDEEGARGSWPDIPAGEGGINSLINTLGDRLLGILVINFGWTKDDPRNMEAVSDLMRFFCGFQKPMVLFDQLVHVYGPKVKPSLQAVIERMISPQNVRRNFVRCYIDGLDGPRNALMALYRRGHRVIGFPTLGKNAFWLRYRLRDLRSVVAELDPAIRVIDESEAGPMFAAGPAKTLRDIADGLSTIKHPFARNLLQRMEGDSQLSADQRRLLQLTGSLAAFLTVPELTALIAPSDTYAAQVYRWLLFAGIEAPKDISLVSFDDRLEETYPHSVSSINFGFDQLGFTAFHAMLGDIPVETDAWRSVAAVARVNHFGTIGPAPPRSQP